MDEITVRRLEEADWREYRNIRLAALTESADAFAATYAEAAAVCERAWRDQMHQADRLLAERDGTPLGVVSLDILPDVPQAAEVAELWVAPHMRNTGVASRLVQAAASQAAGRGCTHLYYWAGTSNGRAIGFATNSGFRPTAERRPVLAANRDLGDQEVALVLYLAHDPSAVPTPAPSPLMPQQGPR